MRLCSICLALLFVLQLSQSNAAEKKVYQQKKNVVYAERDGVGLIMDIFVPTGKQNGKAIVDIVSGGFNSNRGKIRQHERAKLFEIMCKKGYVVFGIRPGSISKFSGPEMLVNINKGIDWVVAHAKEYKVDGNNLGLMGASAGGYLACMTAVAAQPKSSARNIKAVGVFFPPTDFTQYGPFKANARAEDILGFMIRKLLFPNGVAKLSDKKIKKIIIENSPAHCVTSEAPPFIIFHGNLDFLVPLQQSKVFLAALKKANVPAELIIKQGGTHPWPTISEEVAQLGDWFDKQLLKKNRNSPTKQEKSDGNK